MENSSTIYHYSWTRTKDGKQKFKIYLTDENGDKLRPVLLDLPMLPYFYAKKDIVDEKGIPEGVQADKVMTANYGEVYKMTCQEIDGVVGFRDFYGAENTMEADVPYARRVMIDKDITISYPKKRLYLDIEIDPRKGVPNEEKAEQRILSISATDQDGNTEFFCEDDEIGMLSRFLFYMDKFPVICTWYGNHFDWPYLQNRCKRLDIRGYWDSYIHIDLLAVYKHALQLKEDRYDLEHISEKQELKHRKASVSIRELWDSFIGDREKLKDRNTTDSILIYELDQKLNLSNIVFDIAKASHTTVKDLLRINPKNEKEWNTSIAIDGLSLFMSSRRTPIIIWPTKRYKRDDGEDIKDGDSTYTGALVLDPISGVHTSVIIMDVKAMYPSIIRSLNVGLEAYRQDGSGDNKAPIGSFVSSPESIMAEAVRTTSELRKQYRQDKKKYAPDTLEYKNAYAKDYAMKVISNAIYGVSGSKRSRYYLKDVAENVTLTGRRITRFMEQELTALEHTVIGGDTDSIFFKYNGEESADLVEEGKFIAAYLTERIKSFLTETFQLKNAFFELELQTVCSSMYIQKSEKAEGGKDVGTKKRYAYLSIWHEGKSGIGFVKKGLETVRHDWPDEAKKLQDMELLMKLTGGTLKEQIEAANEYKRKLFAGELDTGLVVYKGLNKEKDEYKVVPPHLRVANMLAERGLYVFHRGDKIGYIKIGQVKEQIVPVVEGIPIDIETGERFKFQPVHYAFIWDKVFKRILDRLEIPTESEFAKYKESRRKSRRGDLTKACQTLILFSVNKCLD